MKKFLALILLSLTISSCASGRVLDVKSPCVSTDDGPCGPRRSVNEWWLKNNSLKS